MSKVKCLTAYQKAINDIDDYFEYRYKHDSVKDIKQFVDNVLIKLNESILAIAGVNSQHS